MIKYLGSKRTLIPLLLEVMGPADGRTVLDVFSGTARVAHALKAAGFAVRANDHNAYAYRLAQTYVEADDTWAPAAHKLVAEFNRLPGQEGYFTATYCRGARYLHPKNGARVDAIRRAIADKALPPLLEAVCLTALIEAADRVDSTCGVQMAFLKKWAKRAHNDLELRVPALLPRAAAGPGFAHRQEALDFVRAHPADVAYLDPPYNQHSYLGNYHVWETLAAQDEPAVYGIAHKRVDVKTRKSPFNRKTTFRGAFEELVAAVRAPTLVVSFSDEGYLDRAALEDILSRRGRVSVVATDYKRYVGAQIGIHNLKGEKVGRVSHLRNTEYVFVVESGAASRRAAPAGVTGAGAGPVAG